MPQSNGRRTSRRDIYRKLRQMVLTLELAPGAALSENELAASLGVSRTPVRESLILLAQEGLVQVFPKIGSFVSRVDPAQVADAQFLREAVELASLEDLPERLDTDIVAELRDNLERQRAGGLGLEEFFALDEEFHQGLLRLSGHGNAWTTVAAAKGHLDRARRLGLHGHESPAVFADQHLEIFAAVADGDVPLARARMRGHLRAVFNDIERIRAHAPELFAADPSTVPVRRSVVVWE
ncbi:MULTISPECIES: GntR family transcriptional regulator [Streptomyces]|jgi:DNA-binding GntR family transcriptional regulator|uniref:DNA-binding GntR family transcriptional regulator n=2 Tax=Streptomyces TaxID=1883 RepID=A0ABT9LRP2_STRGD|nr:MULTISPECIES: GntR family transcriptional regulator [Streptomyces]MDP9686218.1 DNA-binding GntR family transcriptional regulator [Streptomyces griseoviridis]GGT15402.1 GntR family transcriptional regulator [Streptomyces griseoviridis]GGU57236.1 GntR family transcriptional regulator [Streptomyces daghestanicus]GHI35507.1 GntR family transcriptional regulator [Streptomyces daghestanicus]